MMTEKSGLLRQLGRVRQMTERLLADFQSPEQWVHQVHPNCNHALWFAGHMATTDNFLLSLVAPERAKLPDGFQAKFGVGSQPTNDPAAYPPSESVLATMRERRSALLNTLEEFSDEELSRKTPAGAPEFLPDFGSVFELAVWHEGLHAGQLTVVRRALGYPPVMGG
jgi:uncharacterized damage-inducible protein DinB